MMNIVVLKLATSGSNALQVGEIKWTSQPDRRHHYHSSS